MTKEKVLLISESVDQNIVPHLVGKKGYMIKSMMRPFGVVFEGNNLLIYGFESTNIEKLNKRKNKWFQRARNNAKKNG